MKIAFHSNQLCLRGTEVALYDYAIHNRIILGNESIIISNANANLDALNKFKEQFPVYLYNDFQEVNNIIEKEKIDVFYAQKSGFNDGKMVKSAKNVVHAVFTDNEPHGDVYAYISEWLSLASSGGKIPYVPYMVSLPDHSMNYIETLNLKDKLVIGWYGGDNFEIPFAREAVIDIAKKRNDIVFLFMNQTPFVNQSNIMFIKGTYNVNEKVAFINTCDAMIHARAQGETFGLAIAEFSSKGKPIITYRDSPERNHNEVLKDKGFYYSNYRELYELIDNFTVPAGDYNCYKEFTPENVMLKFKQVFL